MRPNLFKERLAKAEPQFGLWLGLANAYTAEICAGAGFDWVVIDGEHAPNDIRSTLAQLQVVQGAGAQSVVRPPYGDTPIIKQLLDIGCQNLLIPMVETAAQAQAIVAAVHYPPRGVRGVGSALARASDFNRIPDYLDRAGAGIGLLIQIETRRGVENIDAILKTEGIDGVFIGPSDLAAAFGHLGHPDHPEVQAVIAELADTLKRAGMPFGILATAEAAARRYLEMGANFVAVGTDVGLLVQGLQQLSARFNRATAPSAPSGY
ncbi:aldolase/citrate lyase family protein [Pseudochelatococcus sp. B33]